MATTSPSQQVPSESVDQSQVTPLLRRIQEAFRTLKVSTVDETQLRCDVEELASTLVSVEERIANAHEFARELQGKVRTEDGKRLFLISLESDPALGRETRERLAEAGHLVDETEEIVEILYKVSSSRHVLGRLKDSTVQRAIQGKLGKLSVTQEKVFETRRSLRDTLDELERRGIDARVKPPKSAKAEPAGAEARDGANAPRGQGLAQDLEEESGARTPKPNALVAADDGTLKTQLLDCRSASPGRESTLPLRLLPRANDRTAGRETCAESKTGTEVEAEIETPRSDEKRDTETGASLDASPPELSASDRERASRRAARAADQMLAERPNIRSGVRANKSRGRSDSATKKGARPSSGSTTPPPVDLTVPRTALRQWAKRHPMAKPDMIDKVRFLSVREETVRRVRVETLWATRRSRGESEEMSGEALWEAPASPPAGFARGREKSASLSTRYEVRSLVLSFGDRASGGPSVGRASGKLVAERKQSALAEGRIEDGLVETVLQDVRDTVDDNAARSQLERFLKEPTTEPSQRLVRALVRVEVIEVIRAECEFRRLRRDPHRFTAWVYGQERRLRMEHTPGIWSWRTTGWLAGLAATAVPLGWLLGWLVG